MAMTASICAAQFMFGVDAFIVNVAIKASTPNMNCAATTVASTHQRRVESTDVETIWCMRRALVRNLLHPTVTDSGYPGDYSAGKWIWPDCCIAITDSCSLFGRLRVQDCLQCTTMTCW